LIERASYLSEVVPTATKQISFLSRTNEPPAAGTTDVLSKRAASPRLLRR
jgi:hypothetical protein